MTQQQTYTPAARPDRPVAGRRDRGLAEMYVGDDRFMRNYDDRAPVLAPYVRDAIVALSPEA